MSIWISRPRSFLALLAAALLAACFETVALRDAVTRDLAQVAPVGAVGVLGGTITIAGPDGWCVDPGATRETDEQAFALLRPCRAGRASPVLGVTVTDTRVPPGDRAAQLSQLADFLVTDAGRGQLSRRGRPGDVTLEPPRIRDGALWLYLTDSGNPEAFEPGYWRVVMPLAGRLVTLTALSLAAAPSNRAAGEAAMAGLIEVLRRRNLDR